MRLHHGTTTGALVVNLFGGPGSGKTTLAARLFAELKCLGLEAACPEEHAKLMIWSGRPWMLDHQIVIMGKIQETLLNLRDKVDVIVLDSPILLASVYGGDRESAAFHQLVREIHGQPDRVNLFVNRSDAPYDPANRREDEGAARRVDKRIREVLAEAGEVADETFTPAPVEEIAHMILSLTKDRSGPEMR